VFVDFNQNAFDRNRRVGVLGARAADARVSTPLRWDEVPDCRPEAFTIATVPARFAEIGDPWESMDSVSGVLDPLLDLADRLGPAGEGAQGCQGIRRSREAPHFHHAC